MEKKMFFKWEKTSLAPEIPTWQYYAELSDGRIVEGYASPNGVAIAAIYPSHSYYALGKNYKEIMCLCTSNLSQAKQAIEITVEKIEVYAEGTEEFTINKLL